MIEIAENVSQLFADGEIVFRITSYPTGILITLRSTHEELYETRTEKGIAIDRSGYEDKLYSHKYTPLLFVSDLPYRLAYLFGCLNLEFRKKREETFVFWYRRLKTKQWKMWFIVRPYVDPIFDSTIKDTVHLS